MNITHLAAWCAAHAPAEVEYLCNTMAWSAFWLWTGWVLAMLTILLTGGRK